MSLSVWKTFLSSLKQRNPSAFSTNFIPDLIILLVCFANIVIPPECVIAFLYFGLF